MASKDGADERRAQRDLVKLRAEVDRADRELMKVLKTRMRTVDRIGRVKVKHGLPLLQQGRYAELMETRLERAAKAGLDAAFTQALFELIHDEALRIQHARAASARKEKRKS